MAKSKTKMYILTGGSHVQDGRIFKKGDIVESKDNLRRKFVNKFLKAPKNSVPSKGTADLEPYEFIAGEPEPKKT